MKKTLAFLMSLIVLITMAFGTVSAADTTDAEVSVEIVMEDNVVRLTVSNIPVKSEKQMLSISLVRKDINESNISEGDVAYTQTFYLNGKDTISHEIDVTDVDVNKYRLLVKDSHNSVSISKVLVATETVVVDGYTTEQYAQYRKEEGNVAPVKEGYVFAGWFSDETCTEALDTDTTMGTAYAKFVEKGVLTAKAQISAGATADSEYANIRFISTVNSLDFQKVGFEIAVEGKETVNTHFDKVYETIMVTGRDGVTTSYRADQIFGETSNYFFTCKLTEIPTADFDMEFTVTPYWVTLDGTTVYGESVVRTVSMGFEI